MLVGVRLWCVTGYRKKPRPVAGCCGPVCAGAVRAGRACLSLLVSFDYGLIRLGGACGCARVSPVVTNIMKIALAGCSIRYDGVETERPFWEALAARGVSFEQPDWEDPDVDWRAFDAVVVRTTWTYHRAPERFLRWAEQVAQQTRLYNSVETLQWNTDKSYLADLADAGVPVASTVWLPRGERADLSALLAAQGWQRGFLKPLVGAVASDTHRFDAGAESLREAQSFLDQRLQERSMMLQPYYASVETQGEVSVVLFDGEPAHAVRKLPVAGDYRVQDEHGASDHPMELDQGLVAIARQALAVAPGDVPPLYARADFLFGEDQQPVINELELVEPMLFFQHRVASAADFVDVVLARLSG